MVATSWHVFWYVHSINNEEKHLASVCSIYKGKFWSNNCLFLITSSLDLLTENLYCSIFLCSANWFNEHLFLSGNNLMEGELQLANKIMFVPSFKILEIINIIHDYFEELLLLKFVWYVEGFNPFWVEVVHNDLSHSNHLPHVASLFVKYCHAICSCESIQIWQFLACKRES